MKVRSDFVTNSSSSSFLIAFKKGEEKDELTKLINEIIDLVMDDESGYETDVAKIINNRRELVEYLKENYVYKEDGTLEEAMKNDSWLDETYQESIEWLNKGYKVAIKYIDYSNDLLEDIIRLLAHNSECIKIVKKD